MVDYIVSLGTETPTDCCLRLTMYSGMEDVYSRTVEFGPESLGWRILSSFWDIHAQSHTNTGIYGAFPTWLGDILIEGE